MADKRKSGERPHDTAAEQAVLGALMLDQDIVQPVLELIAHTEMFYLEKHRKVFAAIRWLHESQMAIDPVTVSSRLTDVGDLGVAGGVAYLSGLPDQVPVTTNVTTYAERLYELWQKRQVLDLQDEIKEALAEGKPLSRIHAQAEQLARIAEPRQRGSSMLSAAQALEALTRHQDKQLEAMKRSESGLTVPTPWHGLNELLGGGWKGGRRPYVIAAQEKVGKTQVVLKAILHAARLGMPCVLFELEGNHIEVICRLLGLVTHINPGRLEQWVGLSDRESSTAIQGMEDLYALPVYIDGRTIKALMGYSVEPSTRPGQMREAVARLERSGVGPRMIVVDYIQNMRPDRPTGDERRDCVQISVAMREWATELDYPMIEVAQCLSREENKATRPSAKTIEKSGQFAKDANMVIIADREPLRKGKVGLAESEQNAAQLIIDRREYGPRGVVDIEHDPINGDWKPVWVPDGQQEMFGSR